MKINNKEKVKKVEKFLKCFSKISNEEKKGFIKNCPRPIITCLSETCYNLLKNKHLKKKILPTKQRIFVNKWNGCATLRTLARRKELCCNDLILLTFYLM